MDKLNSDDITKLNDLAELVRVNKAQLEHLAATNASLVNSVASLSGSINRSANLAPGHCEEGIPTFRYVPKSKDEIIPPFWNYSIVDTLLLASTPEYSKFLELRVNLWPASIVPTINELNSICNVLRRNYNLDYVGKLEKFYEDLLNGQVPLPLWLTFMRSQSTPNARPPAPPNNTKNTSSTKPPTPNPAKAGKD